MTTDAQGDRDRMRAELAATIDAIEFKLNVPAQARLATDRAIARVRRLKKDNPEILIGVAVGTVAVVAGAVWLILRTVSR